MSSAASYASPPYPTMIVASMPGSVPQNAPYASIVASLVDPATGLPFHCSGCNDAGCNVAQPGYTCSQAACGCQLYGGGNGQAGGMLAFTLIGDSKSTNPNGEIILVPVASGFGYAVIGLGELPGTYNFQIRFEGEWNYASGYQGQLDNSRFAPSAWMDLSCIVVPAIVTHQTLWSNVTVTKATANPGDTNTISGTLKDETGAVIAGMGGYAWLDSWPIGPWTTDANGNFTENFNVGGVPGTHTVTLESNGDSTHVTSDGPSTTFTVSTPPVITTVMESILPYEACQWAVISPVTGKVPIGCAIFGSYGGVEQAITGTFPVSIYITPPNGSETLYKTVNVTSAGYSENYTPTAMGTYKVRYAFSGDSTHTACSASSSFVTATAYPYRCGVSFEYASVQTGQPNSLSGQLNDVTGSFTQIITDGCQGAVTVFATLPGATSEVQCSSIGLGNAASFSAQLPAPSVVGTYKVRIYYNGDRLHSPMDFTATFSVVAAVSPLSTYMVCVQDQALIAPGSQAAIGVQLFIGNYPSCPPTCPPPSGLVPTSGTLNVDIYLKKPGETTFTYFETVQVSGTAWTGQLLCNTVGQWAIMYQFTGTAQYAPCETEVDWIVGQCSAPSYETCPDGSQMMTQDCQNYEYVPTGNVCPSIPTQINCSAEAKQGTGSQVIVGDVLIYQVAVIAEGGQYQGATLPAPVDVKVLQPDGTVIDLGTVISGTQAYYFTPTQYGAHMLEFSFAGGVISAIGYGASSNTVSFDAVNCVSGMTSDMLTCPDGSSINQLYCDTTGKWAGSGKTCPTPTCRQQHPTSQCISGHTYDCVGEDWEDTGQTCGGGGTTPNYVPIIVAGVGAAAIIGIVAYVATRKKK